MARANSISSGRGTDSGELSAAKVIIKHGL